MTVIVEITGQDKGRTTKIGLPRATALEVERLALRCAPCSLKAGQAVFHPSSPGADWRAIGDVLAAL